MEAVLLLAYGDAAIVKSGKAAERVNEAVEHIGLTACVETRRLNDLSDKEKDDLASEMERAKVFQRDIISGERETSRLMDNFLLSRSAVKEEKEEKKGEERSRLPPSLPTISIRITDPKLLQDIKDKERRGEAGANGGVVQRVTPTLAPRKSYDPQPSSAYPGKEASASPPGKGAIPHRVPEPVGERMRLDYKEALSMEKERSMVHVWEKSTCDDGMNGEDSGIEEPRLASPDFEESVEESSVEVIDESTHVKYDESAEERGGPDSNDETEDCAAAAKAQMLRDNGDLQRKERTTACGKLNQGKGEKRKSNDKIGDEKDVKEARADGEEWLHLNLEEGINSPITHKHSKYPMLTVPMLTDKQ